MMDKRKIYKKLMVIGRATGCHQLPERSFSFRGKQFPVCARCTGVFIGEVLGIFLFKVGEISNIIAVVFSLIMFADWFVQYKFHYESNNIRRLITGLLCGYAFGNIIMKYPELVMVVRRSGDFYEIKTILSYDDELKDRITALSLYSKLW